ncbi:MAG: translational GTPase TypA [Candidatus Blackburnbacteria bacterium]|nr:translational GTPase TypA [Candidatus Blackburnbacteria bacterium]
MNNIRNVAIIAHVDCGKTTLVDALLRQTRVKLSKELVDQNLIMDSNELEKERGITIFSKNASVVWQGTKINIIDTPGHADFGGEVERVLKMADGALLLVDAKEGPMPQTRFVLKRALEMGLKIIVVINKIDKKDARVPWVLNKTFDLFIELGADEKSAYFPVVYAVGRDGLAGKEPNVETMQDISPIFEAIIENIPAPAGDPEKPLQMLVTTLSPDNFKGRIATGRIYNGKLKAGQDVVHINREGISQKVRISSLMTFEGLNRTDTQEAQAGDIVAIAGIPDITIGETIADPSGQVFDLRLPLLSIEEPTIKMTFMVNSSPFAGQEGEFKTSRQIRERLYKEVETDVALRVEDDSTTSGWIVSGRGQLHLAILIERLRREGYEFQVSRPQVIIKEINGVRCTPYEWVSIETPEVYSGTVIQEMGLRHGELQDMHTENGLSFLEYIVATKELFGFRTKFLTDTRGLGILNTVFYDYRPDSGVKRERDRGSLVAHENGVTSMYGLVGAQDRGTLFLGPAVSVYKGQVVGQNSRSEDIRVNVCREKHLTNMRSKGDGAMEHFNTPKNMSLEDALEYIDDSELVEVTPKNIRIRKIILDVLEAKRAKKFGSYVRLY